MTSGNFKTVPISSIVVDRAARQRANLTDINGLADSIRRIGLINPPVIRKDGQLVAGERRLTACINLGWTSITVQYLEDMPPEQAHLVELEENLRRVDLEWKDQCLAIAEYHRMCLALAEKNGEAWTAAATAKAVGMTDNEISQKLRVAQALLEDDDMVKEAPKFSVARGIVQRQDARKKSSIISAVNEINVSETTKLDKKKPDPIPLQHRDFHQWVKDYKGNKFNFIHCDFPYGIGADQHDQGNAAARGSYNDTVDTYYQLIQTFANNLDRFCDESAHLMFWFSMEHYEYTKDALEAAGFKVLASPLIWVKSDNSGIMSDARRQPRRVYETAFMASRGDRFIAQAVSNAFASPNTKEIHMSEKPKPVLSHFFRMFVDEYSRVLDPTCGSGNALKVAKKMGAQEVLGLEQDENFYAAAVAAWQEEEV